MIEDFTVYFDNYYCNSLNLFTPEPHDEANTSCCVAVCINMRKEDYQPNCWFPANKDAEIEFAGLYDLITWYVWSPNQ